MRKKKTRETRAFAEAASWRRSESFLRFVYMYIFRLGFLDGYVGFHFCRFIGAYDDLVAMKLHAIRNGHDPDPNPVKRGQ